MSHTKSVNIRCKYVNEYVKDGLVKIVLVQSPENDSRILTKNLVLIYMRSFEGRWWVRHFKMFLASKIFEVKRKGVRDVDLTSNISFKNIWVKPDYRSVMSVEDSTYGKSTDR